MRARRPHARKQSLQILTPTQLLRMIFIMPLNYLLTWNLKPRLLRIHAVYLYACPKGNAAFETEIFWASSDLNIVMEANKYCLKR